ncbi:DUF262 domain-containing HNH endonuclease family protein [Empedobacter falsenii]|uniref:DUF262 domain-containing HNH endonuclease family protein n=1 Tax=Empedobacter falsenii TaxID=343874 RepID=A0ABY8V884_9FLAO|nr:DUF262 domain-containing HNH endonuclease family protein [Empedobacter falsenii]WIH96504.1 DUF262 domain-containing HNH endonuclease family protein [Empedobacter falsenii]
MGEAKDIFKPDNKTIQQIFRDTDAFYNMPIYQRPYSWDKERVEQLWYDIVEAFRNNQNDPKLDPNYFLGSVVVVKKDNGYEVVDGQQRLTTLTILFCTLRDLGLDISPKYKALINACIKDDIEEKDRLILTTHLNNQANFEESVINGINFTSLKKEIVNNRFLQNAYYFKELIEQSQIPSDEYHISDFNAFIDYFFNNVTLIRIVCFDEGFAIKLFSVLNDRGLDLTPADIIKAHLLQNLDETRRNSFIEVWKRIETTAKHSGETVQSIFNLYLYYLKAENPRKALQDELKEQFKGQSPQQIILDIEKYALVLSEINNETKDKDISLLRYVNHSIYWKTILATAIHTNYKQYDELKTILRKYYYQSWIAGGTLNRIKQTSFNILKAIKSNKDVSEIKSMVIENLNKYENFEKFLDNENLYFINWHKAILLAVEYYEQDDREYIPITRELHTEHILPQEWNKEELNWKDYFESSKAQKLLNSLGNLTLLSGTKNIRASNRNFVDKQEIYSGKGIDGKTSFEITKAVLENNSQWDEDSINKRAKWLKERISTIFTI